MRHCNSRNGWNPFASEIWKGPLNITEKWYFGIRHFFRVVFGDKYDFLWDAARKIWTDIFASVGYAFHVKISCSLWVASRYTLAFVISVKNADTVINDVWLATMAMATFYNLLLNLFLRCDVRSTTKWYCWLIFANLNIRGCATTEAWGKGPFCIDQPESPNLLDPIPYKHNCCYVWNNHASTRALRDQESHWWTLNCTALPVQEEPKGTQQSN
jgi:hypothetical protein